ncbi:hypothetical protein HYH03_014054 [Edaphochlamys debaryana]|uniref:Uncharacterized protein n=1 Tax=Edaphochlamys debaryana TaxID=47281 RepID=A0A835XNJ6_9CHLO|nr:hypothetical protein HYH03_014054 [Edaphochlamys debaryana]|eukprot:KAG2487338.1 hypothetical protein HYH03_014054 [Edaphochlamys debaryana]
MKDMSSDPYGEGPDELQYKSYRESDIKHLKQRIVRVEMQRSQMGAKLMQYSRVYQSQMSTMSQQLAEARRDSYELREQLDTTRADLRTALGRLEQAAAAHAELALIAALPQVPRDLRIRLSALFSTAASVGLPMPSGSGFNTMSGSGFGSGTAPLASFGLGPGGGAGGGASALAAATFAATSPAGAVSPALQSFIDQASGTGLRPSSPGLGGGASGPLFQRVAAEHSGGSGSGSGGGASPKGRFSPGRNNYVNRSYGNSGTSTAVSAAVSTYRAAAVAGGGGGGARASGLRAAVTGGGGGGEFLEFAAPSLSDSGIHNLHDMYGSAAAAGGTAAAPRASSLGGGYQLPPLSQVVHEMAVNGGGGGTGPPPAVGYGRRSVVGFGSV